MFDFLVFSAIAAGIMKPFISVTNALCRMCAAIKAKVVHYRTHEISRTGHISGTEVEAARKKWVAPRLSFPGTSSMSHLQELGG